MARRRRGGLVYEDNLSRAAREADQKSDLAFVPRLSVGHRFQLTDSTSLGLTADLRRSAYTELHRLDNLAATLTLGHGRGPTALQSGAP